MVFVEQVCVAFQALKAPYSGRAELGNKVGVLGVHLLNAAITWIAAEIENRRQYHDISGGSRLASNGCKNTSEKVRIPGGSQAHRCWEGRRPRPHRAVKCLAVEHDRNTKARVFEHPCLQQVPSHRPCARV